MATPFKIQISDAALSDLQTRLSLARLPDEGPAGEEWTMGAPSAVVADLLEHWRDSFDWRVAEARLNRMPQFTADVPTSTEYSDGKPMKVHFVHQRSSSSTAIPLLLLHGWPGSFWEFEHVLSPLTSGPNSFHVVAPSLPGYTFSEAPRTKGFDVAAMARLFDELMHQLGYAEYVVQGGDWGAVVAKCIGNLCASSGCRAVHVNMPLGLPPAEEKMTEEQKLADKKAANFRTVETGYQAIQGTKPQTIGYGLNDSPLGLMAWILEKFHGWSDIDSAGGLWNAYNKDDVLTNVCLYWFSGCITSSARLYYESLGPLQTGAARKLFPQKVTVPCGVALFSKEPFASHIREWVEKLYSIRRWSEFPEGGHFAAREQPSKLVEDVKAFFFESLSDHERPGTNQACKL